MSGRGWLAEVFLRDLRKLLRAAQAVYLERNP
jgi:hypothetical protein